MNDNRSKNMLQIWIILLDDLFCIFLVGCITLLSNTTGNWKLMFFYLLAVIAFLAHNHDNK